MNEINIIKPSRTMIIEDLEYDASEVLRLELDRIDDERRAIPVIRTHSRTACERKKDSREHQEKLNDIKKLESKLKLDFLNYILEMKKSNKLSINYPKFIIK